MDENTLFLYDDTEETTTRFVSFVGETGRFDLVIVFSNRFYNKKLVMSIQNGCCAIVGPDDLEEEGYIAHAFKLPEEEAEELTEFLYSIV